MFQVEIFWVETPCGVVAGYQRFRGELHPEDGCSMNHSTTQLRRLLP